MAAVQNIEFKISNKNVIILYWVEKKLIGKIPKRLISS